jgi:hypothetical protein
MVALTLLLRQLVLLQRLWGALLFHMKVALMLIALLEMVQVFLHVMWVELVVLTVLLGVVVVVMVQMHAVVQQWLVPLGVPQLEGQLAAQLLPQLGQHSVQLPKVQHEVVVVEFHLLNLLV